ncbi:MAG: STAS domain-containing protein [Planctomycetota bacterium]
MVEYEEAPGVLKVNKDLGWVLEDELREKCRKLLSAKSSQLTIDISDAEHVCSANMVVFAYVGAMAAKRGKQVRMLVSNRVARIFRNSGFEEFLDLEPTE